MVKGKRIRAIGLLLGVFLLGGIAGAATTHVVAHRGMRGMMSRKGFEHRRVRALARRLDLSREQTAKVREILNRRGEERRKLMDEMREECGEPMVEHRKKTDDEIRALLTDEQKPKFEKLLERRGRRGPHRGRHRGPPRD